MPYESDAQRKFMHAEHPEIAAKWDKEEKTGHYADADLGDDSVAVVSPNGEEGTIPRANLQEAKQAGFTVAAPTATPTATALPNIQQHVKAEDIGEAGTYNVVAPDGTPGTVPTEALPSALKSGFMLKSEHAAKHDFQSRVDYYKRDLKDGAAGGNVETGLRGYADEFLAGGANKLEQWLGQSKEEAANPEVQLENKAYNQAREEVDQEQALAHGAGAVAGFVGQAYLGGKLAGAAAPSVAGLVAKAGIENPLVEAAAKEALLGGVSVTPQALAQAAINKDPQGAAESLLIGIGTGGILGAGLKAGSRYFAAEEKAAAVASHPISLNTSPLEVPTAENAIHIGANQVHAPPGADVATEEAAANLPIQDIGGQAKIGGKFTKGKYMGLGDLGVDVERGELPQEPVHQPLMLGPGEVKLNPDLEHGPNYTPDSEPAFHIGEVGQQNTVNSELNTTEKLLLEHLGLTRSMRRNIGDAEDQRRILSVVAKEMGEGDLQAGTKKLAGMTKEELANHIKSLTEENGPRIGAVRKQLDAEIAKAPQLAPKIVDATSPETIKNSMLGKILQLKDNLVSPEEEKVVDHAYKFLTDNKYVSEEGGAPRFKSFSDADKVKSYFQDRVDWTAKGAEKAPNRVAANIARIVRESVEDAAKTIAEHSKNPKLMENWSNYKTLYGVGKTLDLAADNTLNAPISHEFIPGGHGALGAGYLGHVIGGAAGIPIVGPVLGVLGAKMAKNYLREGGIAKAAVWLGGRIKDPAISSYIAMDAIKATSERLDNIPRMVKSFAESVATRIPRDHRNVVDSSIKVALGEEATGLSKEQQFERLAQHINFAKGNQESQQQHVSQTVEGLAQYHPQLAQDLSAAMQKKLEYLYTILPKNPNVPMPFKHQADWKPTPEQLHDFQKQLAIANDPFHALEELQHGTLTPSQVGALAVINPDLLMKMRGELIRVSQDKKNDLPLQKRLTMAIMLGQSMDQELMSIPAMTPMGPAGGKKKGGRSPMLKSDKLPDYRTSFDKVVNKSS